MTTSLAALALSVALTAAALAPALAAPSHHRSGMAGGDCATVGMMGGPMMGGGMMGGGMMGGHDGMRGSGMMDQGVAGDGMPMMGAQVEERLASLKTELAITDDQAGAWEAYAEAMERHVEGMQGMHASMLATMEDGTAIERLEVHIASMEAMLEMMKALQQPTEALYEALSEEQKALADQLIGCGGM